MSVSEPGKIITPWAESGLKNTIPPAANPATGRAGFDQGFSAINMTAKEAGGIPPFGQDFNGIFYEVTNILRYMQAGGKPTYDAALAAAIDGYPSGAVLIGDDGVSVFQNAVAGNETDPNSGGDGWTRPDLQVMELYRRSYAEVGYNVVGTFQAGFTIVNANDIGIDEVTGKGFTGPAGPVAAGTDPTLPGGGYVPRSDVVLRDELTSGGSTIDDIANLPENFASYDYPAQNASVLRVVDKSLHVGNGDVVAPAAYRDAVLVSRGLNGLTDCHAFADRTIISDVTDSGTYGTFDATTKVIGSHAQSHLFAFQDRTNYGGSGSIGTWGNIIWPTHSGSGHVTYRASIQIKDIDITGGGTVGSNIGIEIQNLDSANSNSAITIAQNNGFSIYAPNAGAVQFGGALRVDGTVTHKGTSLFEGNNFLGGPTKVGGYANGTPPQAGIALTVEKNGLPNQGFVDINSLGLSFGNFGDYKLQFVSAAVSRFTIGNASEGYDLYPYAATQKLGRANNPFSAVVLKDTANGNSYKLQVTNGALVISLA